MTLKEYLDNPAGKGDSSLNRAALISTLDGKYDKLTSSKKIECKIFRKLNKSEYYFWLVIPTETQRTNSYDVVFRFFDDGSNRNSTSISKYQIQCFCNAPSFAYTFANVYHKEGLLVESLANKLDKQMITKAPTTRNRFNMVNYDKYLYFGAKFILESRSMSKTMLNMRAISYQKTVFESHIRTFDTIMKEYRLAERKLKGQKDKPESKKPLAQPKVKSTKSINQANTIKAKSPKAPKSPRRPVPKVSKK